MDIGKRALSKFEAWTTECEWNFQNKVKGQSFVQNCLSVLLLTSNSLHFHQWPSKLLLLQAEHQFATGQIKEADATYRKAIESARDHRFINEEAISCELAGIFYNAMGKREQSSHHFHKAVECYESWGAHVKAEALRQETFPKNVEKTSSPATSSCA